ncbi:MAG: hypothetical protein AAGU74_05540 [Bacillota bacterium]
MDGFFTWSMLATYAGATMATGLLTQLLKGIFANMATQLLSYVLALILLLAAAFFTNALTLESGALCVINAAVVSLASNGAYDAIKRARKRK